VLAPGLPEASIRTLTTYAVAGADGLCIAHEIDGDELDLIELFELHDRALIHPVARELATAAAVATSSPPARAAARALLIRADPPDRQPGIGAEGAPHQPEPNRGERRAPVPPRRHDRICVARGNSVASVRRRSGQCVPRGHGQVWHMGQARIAGGVRAPEGRPARPTASLGRQPAARPGRPCPAGSSRSTTPPPKGRSIMPICRRSRPHPPAIVP